MPALQNMPMNRVGVRPENAGPALVPGNSGARQAWKTGFFKRGERASISRSLRHRSLVVGPTAAENFNRDVQGECRMSKRHLRGSEIDHERLVAWGADPCKSVGEGGGRATFEVAVAQRRGQPTLVLRGPMGTSTATISTAARADDHTPRIAISARPDGLSARVSPEGAGVQELPVVRPARIRGGAYLFTDPQGFTGHRRARDVQPLFVLRPRVRRADGEEYTLNNRESWVRMFDRWVPYPFQNNIRYLPKEAAFECMSG